MCPTDTGSEIYLNARSVGWDCYLPYCRPSDTDASGAQALAELTKEHESAGTSAAARVGAGLSQKRVARSI